MDNRGSKLSNFFVTINFILQEQRVDGSWLGKYIPCSVGLQGYGIYVTRLRCTLLDFERYLVVKILSNQINKIIYIIILGFALAESMGSLLCVLLS